MDCRCMGFWGNTIAFVLRLVLKSENGIWQALTFVYTHNTIAPCKWMRLMAFSAYKGTVFFSSSSPIHNISCFNYICLFMGSASRSWMLILFVSFLNDDQTAAITDMNWFFFFCNKHQWNLFQSNSKMAFRSFAGCWTVKWKAVHVVHTLPFHIHAL